MLQLATYGEEKKGEEGATDGRKAATLEAVFVAAVTSLIGQSVLTPVCSA